MKNSQPEYDKEETFRFKINNQRSLSLVRRTGKEDVLLLTGSINLLDDLEPDTLAFALMDVNKWIKENPKNDNRT